MKKYTKHFPNCSKLLLFSAVAMLACSAAQAQNSRHLADTVSGGYGTIVRSYGSDRAVSFFWQANQPVVEVVDLTNNDTYYAQLPYDFTIKDMVVFGDMLYFCGTTSGRYVTELVGQGIIGYIDLSAFLFNTFDFNYFPVQSTTNLNKLAVYDDMGLTHVVAIGEYQTIVGYYSYSQYYFFNCANLTQNPVSYDLWQLDADERPWDVVLTDSLVVCFGYHADPQFSSIYFRKTYKDNIFSSEFDTVHYYDPGYDSYSRTHTIAANKDTIFTSYLNIGRQPATFIRTIDAATGKMTHSQQFDMPDKSEPIDLIYSADNRCGVVMEDFDWGGQTNSNFVYFDPTPTYSYYNTLEYRPGQQFLSMALHDGKFYLAGIGSEWFYKSVNHIPTGSQYPSCPEVSEIQLNPIDTLKHLVQERPVPFWNVTEYTNTYSDVTITSNATPICVEY